MIPKIYFVEAAIPDHEEAITKPSFGIVHLDKKTVLVPVAALEDQALYIKDIINGERYVGFFSGISGDTLRLQTIEGMKEIKGRVEEYKIEHDSFETTDPYLCIQDRYSLATLGTREDIMKRFDAEDHKTYLSRTVREFLAHS